MDEDQLYQELVPLVKGFDLTLVDCRMQQVKGGVSVQLVVYRKSGIGTDDCAHVHKAVAPRLEIMFENRDLRMEVTSPGLDRKIRLAREYSVFIDRGFVFIMKTGHEHRGILKSFENETVVIENKNGRTNLPLADIAKARLDIFEEGKKWE